MAAHNYRKERQWENKIQSYTEHVKANAREKAIHDINRRAENRRFITKLHEERQEAELEDKIMKSKETEMMRKCELQQEERLAQQVDNLKRDEIREMKLRQRLRENCIELRELERQLRTAYTTKELVAQCAEKKAAAALEKMYDKQAYDILKESWRIEDEKVKKQQKEQQIRRIELHHDLQDQLIAAEKQRQRAYYEFLQEKHLIDDITAKIIEEDCKRIEEKYKSQARAREEIAEFTRIQDEERKKRQAQLDEEDKRYMLYLQQRAVQDEELRRCAEERKARKEALTHKLGLQLYEQEMMKMEHDEMLEELHELQAESARESEQKAALEKEIRERLILREMSKAQEGEKERKLREEKEDELRFREEMLAKFAEDQQLEQLTKQKQWEKKREYAKAMQQLLEDRRVAHAEEKQRLIKEQEEEECMEAERRKMIEEERQRILCEHANALIGYLPRGILCADKVPRDCDDVAAKVGLTKFLDRGPFGDPCNTTNYGIDRPEKKPCPSPK